MTRELVVRNRQRTRRVATGRLAAAARRLLESLLGLPDYRLCVHLVGLRTITRLNRQFLGHEGATDVITFDLREPEGALPLAGEIFICVEVAVLQARQYRTRWPEEVLRYLVHGVLHLQGHDDLRPETRRRMKRAEERLLRRLRARSRHRCPPNPRR